MYTSQFMDKQIMDLSNSQSKINNFVDLNNPPPQEDHEVGGVGGKEGEILPNYDFQPIRPLASSQPPNCDSSSVDGARVSVSADSKTDSGIRNYGSLDSVEPAKFTEEKDRAVFDAALISEIDKTMKKHTDNLMHTLEGLSARLSQLETRSRHLENSVDDLKTSVANNHGNSNAQFHHLENMAREVQAGVQAVKDKQEALEAQLQLSQLQISKAEPPPQHHQLPPPPQVVPPAPLSLTPPPIPQHESYYPPSGQTVEAPPHHYHLPPPQAAPPPPLSPQPQYHPPSIHPPHPQQFYGNVNPSQMYEPYPYGGGSSGGDGYPQLPTARVLPHVGPSGGGNRVPIDDVVDKVTSMGFPRDEVRATVRKLTENGQAVDLNIVLDKLMSDGVESQGPRAWFAR